MGKKEEKNGKIQGDFLHWYPPKKLQVEISSKEQHFCALKVISSDLIPSRWVSEIQDVSLLM